ncbi:MAG: hypothetical protein ACJ8LG_20545 [Massilia sp.]
MRLGARFALACALALAGGHALAASQLKLYPVRGLFVAPPEQGGALIHPLFRTAVPNVQGGEQFRDEFVKAFPDAALTVADKDKRWTLVSSMQVVRASHYSVDKVDGTSDVLVPVSGSLYFTNAISGEVLYTVAGTYYARATVNGSGKQVDDARLQAMFVSAYKGLVADLLARAREQFKPHTVAGAVKREWNGLYILDRGQDAGIAKGDALSDPDGNTLDVVYSAPGYAVGSPSLGKIAVNASYARETNLSLSDIKKPRVMVLVDQVPDGFPADIVRHLFSDQLGAGAPVSVVHVNPLFASVLATAFSSTGLSSENSGKRELPDFFIRLNVPESRSFELPTSLRNTTTRSYRTMATAELVDRTGRVLYATSGEDRIDDQVVAGMGFDVASRREVSLKNALLALAKRIGAELKFERVELPLQSLAPLAVQDRNGMLAQGEQLTVFRGIGKVDGVAGEVRVPFQELNVDGVSEGAASAAPGLPLTRAVLPFAPGDVVLLDANSGGHGVTRRRFAACGPAEKLGAVELPAFGELALNTFERNFKAPFYSTSFFGQVRQLVGPDSRFKSNIKLEMTPPDYCVEPVYRVDVGGAQCGGEPRVCTDSATVRITYRIRNGATIAARSGLETKMTGSGYLANASQADHKNSLDSDLLDASGKLAKEIAVKLNDQKIN